MATMVTVRRGWLLAGILAFLIGIGFPASSRAFFFFAWSGELSTQPASLVPPDTDTSANPPSARSNNIGDHGKSVVPGTELPPSDHPPGIQTPTENVPLVPEPATVVLATLGLGTMAAVGVRKLRRHR